MKHIHTLFLLLGILVASSLALYAQDDNASDYFNQMSEQHNNVVNANMDYIISSVHSNNPSSIEKKRREVLITIKKAKKTIEAMPAFNGNSKLRSESVNILKKYEDIMELDFKAASDMKVDPNDPTATYELMEKYYKAVEKAENKLAAASEEFGEYCQAFAEKHEMVLLEGDKRRARILRRITEATVYDRKLSLMTFRVSKAEATFIEAFQNQKVKPMESSRKKLVSESLKALGELKKVKPIKHDKGYNASVTKLTRFYYDSGKKTFASFIQLLQKQEAGTLTKADVKQHTTLNQTYLKERQKLNDELHKSRNRMMKSAIPAGGGQKL